MAAPKYHRETCNNVYKHMEQLIKTSLVCYYRLTVASSYVGMARKQDGGSNRCISIYRHGNIIAREQMLTLKST